MFLLNALLPLLNFYSAIYFWTVTLIFKLINFWFHKWRAVDPPNDDLLFLSATRAAEYIRNRDLKSIDLVEAYIVRINHVNGSIKAMIMDNFETARAEARSVDDYLDSLDETSDEYANLGKTKPLLGVPFTAKNNIFIKGFICTAGVPARLRTKPCDEDAEAVNRLYKAGAILLGVTNVPELGLWWETSNRIFGVTRNPYDLRRTAGGSSGGESALLSAGASVFGLGNDVGGSLRIPPAFCGVYGLKPGPGIVPSKQVYPEIIGGYVEKMASAGPMSRYAEDLAPILRALVGDDVASNRLRLDEPVDFRKMRVFYMEGLNSLLIEPLDVEMRESVRKAAKYFEKKYDKSTHRLDLILAHHALEMYLTSFDENSCPKITESLVNYEYDLNPYTELIRHLFGQSEHTIPAILAGIHSTMPLPDAKHRGFVDSKRDQLRREIIDLLGDDGVLIFPAFPTTAPFVNRAIFTPFNFVYNGLWNALALPVVTCPLGLDAAENVPLAVQIICAPDAERLLLACARDLEEGFGGWVMPTNRRRFY